LRNINLFARCHDRVCPTDIISSRPRRFCASLFSIFPRAAFISLRATHQIFLLRLSRSSFRILAARRARPGSFCFCAIFLYCFSRVLIIFTCCVSPSHSAQLSQRFSVRDYISYAFFTSTLCDYCLLYADRALYCTARFLIDT
jgi:hypothetical protein